MAEKVLIIGSGPAGLTAAIYAARAALEPLMIEGMQRGGQLMLTTDVENYPGFPDGIMGPELMDSMRKQAERFGTRIISSDVTRVDLSERPFKVWVGADLHESEGLIISTGASARWLGIPGEEKLRGYGVSACATCDGFFFRGHEIAVVGGGDSAIEEANFLTKFADKVTLIVRRDELRASAIMQDRATANPKIEFLWNTSVTEVNGTDKVESVDIANNVTGEKGVLDVTGLFIAIGHKPNTDLFRGVLDMDDDTGYLVTRPDSTYTNVPGVFACGDVEDSVYRQAITAAGSGCMAAIDAERWLEDSH